MLTFVSKPPAIPEDYGPDALPTARAPNLNAYNITKALRASLHKNFGDATAGAFAGPLNCKYYSPKSGICIVRCAREGVRYVWGAVTLLHTIDGNRVRVCVRACGGNYTNVCLQQAQSAKYRGRQLQFTKIISFSWRLPKQSLRAVSYTHL